MSTEGWICYGAREDTYIKKISLQATAKLFPTLRGSEFQCTWY